MNFKKITTLLIVTIVAVTSVFATETAGQVQNAKNSEVNASTATTQLTLTVNDEDVESYTFGFSSTNDADSPSVATGITLTMQPDYTAKNDTAYLFYNVRSAKGFTLTLTSTGALDNGKELVNNKKIDYTVKVGNDVDAIKTAVSGQNLEWTKSIADSDPRSATYSIDILTDAIPANGADTYTSTLKLTVTIAG